jgi:hypothetical protein
MPSIGGRKPWARRHQARFPFRSRWLIVKLRSRGRWREVWYDLIYLLRG